MEFPRGAELPQDRLQIAGALPIKPEAVVLTGSFVRLQPLDLEHDLDELYAVSNGQPISIGSRRVDAYDPDKLIWRNLFKGPFISAAALGEFLAELDVTGVEVRRPQRALAPI